MKTEKQIQSEIDILWREFHAIEAKPKLTIADRTRCTKISFDIVHLEIELARHRNERIQQRKVG